MARNTTLSQLRDQLRAEIGASPSVAMGINAVPQMNHMLNRVQERLWLEYDWPFLWTETDIQSVDGVRYYNIPQSVNPDRIRKVMVNWNDYWYACESGIGPAHYNIVNSEIGQKEDNVRRWRIAANNSQIEVWPIPESDEQKFRLFAYMNCPRMTSDSDTALIDDTLIVLFAAAEMLAALQDEASGIKYDQAKLHFTKLKALASKNSNFVLGGEDVNPEPRKLWGRWKENN